MTVGKVALPAWDEIKRQHELIVQRMVDAYHVDRYHEIFSGKACDLPTEYYGTEIMRVIFMEERFHKDCHDWLYIFNHCVLKTVNEAVVEGMGSIVDKHAYPKRGLSQDRYVKESIIDWNGPQTHECEGFLCAALINILKERIGTLALVTSVMGDTKCIRIVQLLIGLRKSSLKCPS